MEMQDSKYMSADEKNKVLAQFKKFVSGGFKEVHFTQDLYNHLHMHCRFIAHMDKRGFYETRFANHTGFMHTVSQLSSAQSHGGHEYKDINTAIAKAIKAADVPEIFRKADLTEADRIVALAKDKINEAVMLKKSGGQKIDENSIAEALKVIIKAFEKAS